MSEIKNDKKVVQEGRSFKLEDTEDLQVTVPLRDQIVQDLMNKLEDDEFEEGSLVNKLSEIWYQANSHKVERIERVAEFIVQVDEFIEPIYQAPTEWSSNLHLPTIFNVVKTMHARFNSAVMGINPPLTVKARKGTWEEREDAIQDLMAYSLKDWANYNRGIEEVVDIYLWDWLTKGEGFLKGKWDRKFTKFKDVEIQKEVRSQLITDPDGNLMEVPVEVDTEVEVDKVINTFDGPCFDKVNYEDIVVVGHYDPQLADYVMQQEWLTASELWSLVDQKVFDQDAVEAIIEAGNNSKNEGAGHSGSSIKQRRADTTGDKSVDKSEEKDRYRIIEAHAKLDVDGGGIDSDIIVWFHPQTKSLLRATYAQRVYPHSGSGIVRPFFRAVFHMKDDGAPAGIPELLYSLSKEIDAMHNLRVDTGILTTLPFGFYRPSTSMEKEIIQFEPGTMIPVDDPSAIIFPNLASKTSFGMQEEQVLQGYVQKMTAMSDLNYGVIGGQGATRTATGTRALVGESNANLDINLKRVNRAMKQAYQFLFGMLQTKLPEGFEFRVTADDGNSYFRTVKTREEIAGSFDFELEPNSANSNPEIRRERAALIYQMTQNPIDLQLGLVTPQERYQALKDYLQSLGVNNISKYARKPESRRLYTPEDFLNMIFAGEQVEFQPTDDIQGFMALAQEFIKDEMLSGQFQPEQIQAVQAHLVKAQELAQALQQAQQQNANLSQQFQNATNQQGQMSQPVAVNTQASVQTPSFE